MRSEAAPTETCLGCFGLLTADQLAALNQALAKDPYILEGHSSIDSFVQTGRFGTASKEILLFLRLWRGK
jgi:hypothetical protein